MEKGGKGRGRKCKEQERKEKWGERERINGGERE